MRRYIITTCHLEAEKGNECLEHWGHDRFFEQIDAFATWKPTLLLCRNRFLHDCFARDVAGVQHAQKLGLEIGLHIHPTPLSYSPTKRKKQIDSELFLMKQCLGVAPKSYAGAHFCSNAQVINYLETKGIRSDLSVVPDAYAISSRGTLVNYLGAPRFPYFPDRENLVKVGGARQLLEFPLTMDSGGRLLDFEMQRLPNLKRSIDELMHAAPNGLHFVNIFFHSYSVVRKRSQGLTVTGHKLIEFLKWVTDKYNIQPISASNAYDIVMISAIRSIS